MKFWARGPEARFKAELAARAGRLFAELSFIAVSGAFIVATMEIAIRAPEFAAIVITGALVAGAIFKRPPTTIETRYVVSDMTIESLTANLDAADAAKVLDMLRDAARNLPEQGSDH